MKDEHKTKEQLINELVELRRRITELEESETKRKWVEETLQNDEKRYRRLIQQSVEAIYMFDPATKRILEANPAFLNILGYTAEEVHTLTIYDFIAHDRESIDAYIQHILTFGGTTVGERVWRRKDRALIDVRVNASKVRQRGRDIIFVVARDIAERKKAESHLIQAAKMGTLGEMASGIAHELNQPLSVIKAGSDFFLKMIKRGEKIEDEELRIVAQEVGTQVDRASDVINHLRIFARLSETVKDEMDVNAPIREVRTGIYKSGP